MKVVFLEDVEGTAQVGEVKEVKNGFARNYLLPRGLAAPAVEPYLRRAHAAAAREAKRLDTLDQQATSVAERIEGTRIVIPARVGEQGKLYGSVTAVHIAEEVGKLIGDPEFDHRKVLLPEAIKEVGIQPVRLRLARNVESTIEVEVVAEGVEPEAAVEAEPAEAKPKRAPRRKAKAERAEGGEAAVEAEPSSDSAEAGEASVKAAEDEASGEEA